MPSMSSMILGAQPPEINAPDTKVHKRVLHTYYFCQQAIMSHLFFLTCSAYFSWATFLTQSYSNTQVSYLIEGSELLTGDAKFLPAGTQHLHLPFFSHYHGHSRPFTYQLLHYISHTFDHPHLHAVSLYNHTDMYIIYNDVSLGSIIWTYDNDVECWSQTFVFSYAFYLLVSPPKTST